MNKCEICYFWQNYERRVWARISEFDTDRGRNIVELRVCGFIPAPQINADNPIIYTDPNYICGSYLEKRTIL